MPGNDVTSQKPKNEDKPIPPPKSACEIYQKLLQNPPQKQTSSVGGGVGLGVSTDGKVVNTFTPSETVTTYDKATCDIVRAKCACEEGFVVNPRSKPSSIFYTPIEKYESEYEKTTKEESDRQSQGFFRRVFG